MFQGEGRKRSDGCKEDDVLLGGFLWNMSERDIEDCARLVWNIVHNLRVHRRPTHYKDPLGKNSLPGKSFRHVFHMRPHGANGRYTIHLPNGEDTAKQCCWLDRRRIARIVAAGLS